MFPRVGFLSDARREELEHVLGISINNVEYFEQALTHRSYLPVLANKGFQSNERLEFLGDAVLGMITAEYLFSLHSNVYEGELTKMRSWLVNKNSLVAVSQKLGLDQFLMLSHSAAKSLENGSDSILADALEAIIAAIYLDSGFEEVTRFITDSLFPIMFNQTEMVDKNYKSILLETAQSLGYSFPVYKVFNEEGPDHDKIFTVGVYVHNELLGSGTGKSKKQAEQLAAQKAIENDFFKIHS